MADPNANHPSLPTNYVSILDLRDRWLKQQQQQQQQQQKPQQQKPEQDEEEANDPVRVEKSKREEGKTRVTRNSGNKNPQFRNPNNFKPSQNPNLTSERGFGNHRKPIPRGFRDGHKKAAQFRAVKTTNSSAEVAVGGGELKNAEMPIRRGFHGGKNPRQQVKPSNSPSESNDLTGTEVQIVDNGGALKADKMSVDEKKKMKKKAKKKKWNEREKGEKKEIAMLKSKVSKNGGIEEKMDSITVNVAVAVAVAECCVGKTTEEAAMAEKPSLSPSSRRVVIKSGEVGWGDRRVMANRKVKYNGRGMRVVDGHGHGGDKCGQMWIKKTY